CGHKGGGTRKVLVFQTAHKPNSSGAKALFVTLLMSELKLQPPTPENRFGCDFVPQRTKIMPLGSFFCWLDGDAELVELDGVDFGRRFGHQILGFGGFGEGDDFADGSFAGEEHDDAVDAEGDAAVRWRAISQCVKEKAEAAAQLLF